MGLDRTPDQLLKAGLAALKQKDYRRAIATFQQLYQASDIRTSHRLKAQMGLIRSYEEQGSYTRAQELCQPLLDSQSQSIRIWAHEKLQQLANANNVAPKHPAPSNNTNEVTDASGFVPSIADKKDRITSAKSDLAPGETVLRPKALKQNSVHNNRQRSSQKKAVTDTSSSQASAPSNANAATDQAGSSLFHYEILNNRREFHVGETTDAKVSTPQNSLLGFSQQSSTSQQQQTVSAVVSQGSSSSGPKTWPAGSRLSKLKSLGKVSMGQLRFAQLATIPLFIWVTHWLVRTTLVILREYLLFLNRLFPISNRVPNFFWGSHLWSVVIGLSLLAIAAPWLWPLLLGPTKRLTSQQIETHSPEASQLLRRFCSKQRWPFPNIQLIDSDLPLIFSYGWRPRWGKLVVSQGLLKSLSADELATAMVYEISHWSSLDWIFFSIHGLLLQGLHQSYWFLARWGETRALPVKIAAGILANLSYSIFWLLRLVGYGLARTRTPYRDRKVAELTGNPNGFIRALVKLSTAMADAIKRQGYTPPLLESLELILPVAPTTTGGASVQYFAWGALNPLRHWLSINQAHPPLGDRLYILSAYGKHWRLKPSLNFAQLQLKHGKRSLTAVDRKRLLLQGGAWSGLVIGLVIALIMWLVGAISTYFDLSLLAWLYQDRSVLLSMPLIAAATGQLVRINPFFPEIAPSISSNEQKLQHWQTDSKLTPLSSLPIKLNGILTGRPALANWLGQEWRLQTTYGSIKLHHTGYCGPLSNIQGLAPWLNQSLQVTGWFRRGHHIWIDLERLSTQQNQTKVGHHPLWSTMISLIPLIYGFLIIFRGA
ncbi:MAG: M48 family metalloprotease [Leptolyngbyaceae cyanobacterium]